jgi:ADP-ribosylglycohydrolase
MMPFLPTNALADLARAEARLTHLHPDAGEASASVVLLCRHLINGMDWQEAIDQTAKEVKGKSKFSLLLPDSNPLNKGGYAPEVLRAAVSIVQSSSDCGSALDASFKFSYPGHYCPILVGAIAGARWGC